MPAVMHVHDVAVGHGWEIAATVHDHWTVSHIPTDDRKGKEKEGRRDLAKDEALSSLGPVAAAPSAVHPVSASSEDDEEVNVEPHSQLLASND